VLGERAASGPLTRFVASEEALGDVAAKQAVVDAIETDTPLTHVFDIVQGFA